MAITGAVLMTASVQILLALATGASYPGESSSAVGWCWSSRARSD